MEIVLYTQRVQIIESYNERRDCADQNIARFIRACGYLPIAVPNVPSIAERIIEEMSPIGIILTGGNSLVKYGGDAPERDMTEKNLLDKAIEKKIPTYGFCRGMQVIADYFGNHLVDVENHVAVRHQLQGKICRKVNSYHRQACTDLKPPLEKIAWTEEGVIEAFYNEELHIFATMWHPERENPFSSEDICYVQNLFSHERIILENT